MNKLFFTIISLAFLIPGMAQVYECGTDYYDSIVIANDPTILQKRSELEAFTKQFLGNVPKNEETLVIPMVFHVLHQYGDERISIETIENGIAQINKDFNAGNTELNSIVSDFKDIVGNANFKFTLAKKDPNGNCTTGVVYYDTDLTYKASNSLKYTIENWDPQSYLNIWTVSTIESGAAAWSHYPGVSSALDGVVSIYRYINGHTLGHEIGHYLNLAHPWGSTNEPGLASNCDIDDNVDDTPLTIGADQHCNLNQVSCGSLDNIQNFMDYSTCDAMFTIGQTDRMRAALNSWVGGRKYLWTEDNLIETGTNAGYEPPMCIPVADFTGDIPGFVPGDSLQFIDYSYASEPTSWNWTFEGGTPSSSSEQNPTITYSTPGLYSVSLTVGNSAGENQLLREDLVFVTDTSKGIIAPEIVDMEDENFPYYETDIFKSWSFENAGSYNWTLHKSDNSSMRIKNYGNSAGTINSMITSNINLTAIENPDYIYFDYAYAQKNENSYDELKIFVSPDCGKKWILKYIKKGKTIVTSNDEFVIDNFVPTNDEWKQDKINITNYKENNFLKIKFQMKSSGGNYFYLDNLNIGKTVSVISNRITDNGLNIFPNPAQDDVTIEYSLTENGTATIQFTNVLGKQVFVKKIDGVAGLNSEIISFKEFGIDKGIYLVTVFTDKNRYSKRLIIQ